MLNSIYQAIDPVIFTLGPFTVRWYGVAYVLGFLCAALVIWRVSKRWRVRVDSDSLLTIMFCVIVGIIVGARLGYVVFYGAGQYLENPLEILAFNKGGMSFHGGLMGALVAGIVAAKITRIPYLTSVGVQISSTASYGVRPPMHPGAWCSEVRRVLRRAIRRSFTRRCSKASFCSRFCSCFPGSVLRAHGERFWACSLCFTARFGSS